MHRPSTNTALAETAKQRVDARQYRRLPGHARLLFRAPLYRGTSVVCPCCGRSFRRFVGASNTERGPNGQCPRCGALERHRLLWLFLEQRTDLFWHAWRVLDLAPEPYFRKRLTRLKKLGYVRSDVESPRERATTDGPDLRYEDESFDSVLCLDVLDLVPDDLVAMCKILRVLKPGGWAIVQSSVMGDETLTQRLESVGFVVAVVPFASQLGDEACRRYGLDPSSASIQLATKPRRL